MLKVWSTFLFHQQTYQLELNGNDASFFKEHNDFLSDFQVTIHIFILCSVSIKRSQWPFYMACFSIFQYLIMWQKYAPHVTIDSNVVLSTYSWYVFSFIVIVALLHNEIILSSVLPGKYGSTVWWQCDVMKARWLSHSISDIWCFEDQLSSSRYSKPILTILDTKVSSHLVITEV